MMCKTLLCLLPLLSIMSAQDSGDLYFMLNGEIYPSGSSVVITEIGEHDPNTGAYNPDSSLACVTSEVNSQCCRERDGGNLGEWQFPDSSMVPRRSGSPGTGFTRSGFNRQVRLNRQNDALSPAGTYTCMVPRDNGEMASANITLMLPTPSSVMGLCVIVVWGPPEGARFDTYTGYDVRFFNEVGESVVRKQGSQFFQVASEDEIGSLGPSETIFVQVRAVSGENSEGPYSEPIPLCPGV